MSSIKERLTDYLNFKKINVYDFQRALGVSKSYVATISKSIQPDKLERISNLYPDLSIGWLMIGQGEMIFNDCNNSDNFSELERLREENSMLIEANRNLSRMLADGEKRKAV